MKFILMSIFACLLVSCGKNGGPSALTEDAKQEEQETTSPRLDGYLDSNSVPETELLNVSLNETVTVAGDTIVFNRPVFIQDKGMRITCSLVISAGEIWHLEKTPEGMEIVFPSGARESLMPSGNTNGTTGIWNAIVSKDNVRIRRRYSFLPNRLIINQDCEQ